MELVHILTKNFNVISNYKNWKNRKFRMLKEGNQEVISVVTMIFFLVYGASISINTITKYLFRKVGKGLAEIRLIHNHLRGLPFGTQDPH